MREDDVERGALAIQEEMKRLFGGEQYSHKVNVELARAVIATMQLAAPTPEPAPGTVRVRVACAVDDEGDWRAAGSSDSAEPECLRAASAGLNIVRQFSWITANLPIPQPLDLPASVEEGR